jgi:transcriptional regulator with XRE-family HTH domain
METDDLVLLMRVRSLARSGAARSVRLAAGLSLAEVAQAVGTGAPTVYRWEQGIHAPSGDLGLKYASVLAQLLGSRW